MSMSLIVNKVEDANCIFLCNTLYDGNAFRTNRIMLDYGKNNYTCNSQLKNSDTFILSHYHQDHYQGLSKCKKDSLRIKRLFYPILPSVDGDKKLLFRLMFFGYVLGDKTGSPELDLIKLIKELNGQNTSFANKALCKGDKIDDFEVIWPPKNLSSEPHKGLCNRINNIRDSITEDEKLRNLWDEVEKISRPNNEQYPFSSLEEKINSLPDSIDIDSAVKNCVLNQIRGIANRLSLCLYKKNCFLFLGDLEKDILEECIKQLLNEKNIPNIAVKYFITPHHGTHYHAVCQNIHAEYVITSNGSNLANYYEKDFNLCGMYNHITSADGDFISCPCIFGKSFNCLACVW